MIKRPVNEGFDLAIFEGRKITTIRDKAWPVGVPIMLYNWSGAPYRSPQIDVAPVVVVETRPITITHHTDGGMTFSYGSSLERPLHETEGFESRFTLADWFRPLVRPGRSVTKHLMRFRLDPDAERDLAGIEISGPRTGFTGANAEGYDSGHLWHEILRRGNETQDQMMERLDPHLIPLRETPDRIRGVDVIGAVPGYLVTLDPSGTWYVLHPCPVST